MAGDFHVVFIYYEIADLHTGTRWLVTFMSYFSIMKLPICTQALDGWYFRVVFLYYDSADLHTGT